MKDTLLMKCTMPHKNLSLYYNLPSHIGVCLYFVETYICTHTDTDRQRHKQADRLMLHMVGTNHLSDALIGDVRQEVNRSAGSSGFIGNISFLLQAASWILVFLQLTNSTLFDIRLYD